MKRFGITLAALAALVWSFPAFAQSSYVIKDGNAAIQTVKSINCSSMICPLSVPGDAAGVPLTGAAGSPAASALTVQGIAGGQPVPVSAASLPLPTGAATQATIASILSALGSPFQAAGSIGNTAFGATQSGSWSVTAVQPTGSNLHIVCDSGCSSSTAPADESAFTWGTTSQTPIGGFFQTTATLNPLTNGQMGAWQFTAQRAGFVNLRNASGTEIGTASTPVQVTGANGTFPVTGTFWQATQPVSGTFWPYTLGQQVAGSSVPVVLTAGQLTTLTPPAAITNYANETGGNLAAIVTDFGAPGATACASDTASCSQNQQLQRLAQRLTSLITAIGAPFQAGASIGNTSFASTQSGTWTVQPGNTPNTSPWLFTINQGGNSAAVKAASTASVQTDAAVVTRSPDIGSIADSAGCANTNTVSGCLKQLDTDVKAPPGLGTAGGWTKKRLSALTNSVVAIKSSAAGQLGLLHCGNSNTGSIFIQIFDVATAGGVTLGTTPPDLSLELTGGSSSGFAEALVGVQFSSGIQIATTTTATGSTAPSNSANCNAGYN